MKRNTRIHRMLLAGVLAAVALSTLGHVAHAAPAEPTVPPEIAVEEGHKLFLVGHAVGVQIYDCKLTGTSYKWTFVAPRANLYDDSGKLIATHFGGPTWLARDGSYAVGTLVRPVPVDGAIAWLLLSTSSAPGSDGGRLAGTTFIQRIATTGGLAPTPDTCNAGSLGTRTEVDYTADYYFWKAIGS